MYYILAGGSDQYQIKGISELQHGPLLIIPQIHHGGANISRLPAELSALLGT